MNRWAAVRHQAQQLLTEFEKSQGISALGETAGPYAVLDGIATHLHLDIFDDDRMPHGMWGYLNRTDNLIGYHADLEAPQRHFVIAHEIGHFYLNHPRRRPITSLATGGTDDRDFDSENDINDQASSNALLVKEGMPPRYCERDFLELQANVFAAELLAPLAKVREMTTGEGWNQQELASYFGLSKEAVAHRIFAARLACPPNQPSPSPLKPHRPLDEKQQAAKEVEGAALILAGPGAGKTRVLTERFAYLVEHKALEPRRILALTYSNNAAEEMRSRLCAMPLFQGREFEVQVYTFHSYGQSLILEFSDLLKFPLPPVMLSEADTFVLLRNNLQKVPLGSFEEITNPTRHLKSILKQISRAKDELASHKDYACEAGNMESGDAQRALDIAKIYECYGKLLKAGNFLDFGDLIRGAVYLLKKPVGDEIRARYDAILVDEFQDINFACGEMVRLLDAERIKTWVVADPRQSIYGFRGASRANLENFKTDFSTATEIHLSTNYRSFDGIVRAGDAVDFSCCEDELLPTEKLSADRGASSSINVLAATTSTRHSEVTAIVGEIRHELSQGRLPKNIAVLCRTKKTAKKISDALEAEGIATTWAGALQEQPAFKDLMAVLLFATGDMAGLLRLARSPYHRLSEPDLRRISREGRGKKNRVLQALYAARKGEIGNLSPTGKTQAEQLRKMALELGRQPNAFCVLSTYLLEFAPSLWNFFDQQNAEAQRYRAAVNQILDMAREFSSKGSLSNNADALAFVDYIRSSLEIESLSTDDSTEALGEAITVTTIHRSKGLEWDVVFVPDWTITTPFANSISFPTGLLHHHSIHQDEYDRACLAYVAVTRARDRLIISRSQETGREPNPQFDHLIKNLSDNQQVEVVRWPYVAALEKQPTVNHPIHSSNPIPFSLLSQYLHCGQSAKYEYIYGLRTDSSGYLLALKSVRETLKWLQDQKKKGGVISQTEIVEELKRHWENTDTQERQIAGFYEAFAEKILLKLTSSRSETSDFEWHQPEVVKLDNNRSIKFHLDEIEYPQDQQPILRFHQWHGQAPTKPQELQLALYSLVKVREQQPQILLHNVQSGEDAPFHLSVSEQKRRLRRLETLSDKLMNGEFETRQGHHCNYCPFLLICPS